MRRSHLSRLTSLAIVLALLSPGLAAAEGETPPLPDNGGLEPAAVVLYDQVDNPAGSQNAPSQKFTDSTPPWNTLYPPFDSLAADDFFIPAADPGSNWLISQVDVRGVYFKPSATTPQAGPADSVNVRVYTDTVVNFGGIAAHVPYVQPFYSALNVVPTGGLADGNFVVPLSAVLTTNETNGAFYWISVQVNMAASQKGQWSWEERLVQGNRASAWINPPGGLGPKCQTWHPRYTVPGLPDLGCNLGFYPDLVFKLTGTNNLINPGPVTFQISPGRRTVGSGSFTLTVTGANFVPSSTVYWNGVALTGTPTVTGSGQISISVPADKLAQIGTAEITVHNGAKISNPQIFSILPVFIYAPLIRR